MKHSTLWLGVALAITAYAGRLAWRAHRDLVTLDVRALPVREVAAKLRWQTWEPVLVGPEVEGTITLRVKDQPLEVVLNILNEQINGRWTAVYPLYSSRKSLAAARSMATAGAGVVVPGWTNWNARPSRPGGEAQPVGFRPESAGMGRPGFGPGTELASTTDSKITLALTNATAIAAGQSIRRQSGARVVAEDGTALHVTLNETGLDLPDAVAAVAKKLHRRWTRLYVLEGRRQGPGSGSQMAQAEGTPRPERPALTDEQRQAMEQMRAQMEADPARQEAALNRMMTSLKNSTPQQRVERDAQRLARKRAQAAR
jgi:hypothetical protein